MPRHARRNSTKVRTKKTPKTKINPAKTKPSSTMSLAQALANRRDTIRPQAVESFEPTPMVTVTATQKTWAEKLLPYQQWLGVGIFIQSLVAMFGSLYYSTFGDPVANFQQGNLFAAGHGLVPCELCWFARILMYPIVFITYVGIAKKDRRFTDYILPLSIIGIALDTYHYALQKLPIPTFFSCSSAVPCNALQVDYFGFITIPFLALVAFIVITVLAGLNTWLNRYQDRLDVTSHG